MRVLYILLLLPLSAFAQDLTAEEVLDKSIAYHDPNGEWESFKGELTVKMTTPNKSPRITSLFFDLPRSYFFAEAKQDDIRTSYTVFEGECEVTIIPEDNVAPPCERAIMYRDYYTYLYGLPMKLKDPGTSLDPIVTRMEFNGKQAIMLQVSYDPEVGSDVWRFYFDPSSYRMFAYQFYKGDPEGKGLNTGEYILLDGEFKVGDMRIPKDRSWYYNKNNEFLGKDALIPNPED